MDLDLFSDGEPSIQWQTAAARDGGSCCVEVFGVPICIEQRPAEGDLGTGVVVWDSSVALAEFVETSIGAGQLEGKSVIEVGAGVSGLPGLAALLGGAARVTLTDQLQILPDLRRNVDNAIQLAEVHRTRADGKPPTHSCEVSVQALDWDSPAEANLTNYDLVLAADVAFAQSVTAPVLRCLASLCGPDTEVLLLYQWRCALTHKVLLEMMDQLFIHQELSREELGTAWRSISREYLHLYRMKARQPRTIS